MKRLPPHPYAPPMHSGTILFGGKERHPRLVHGNCGSGMTGRQGRTADGGVGIVQGCTNTRIYKNPQFPVSGALSYAQSVANRPSHPMAFTHVYRTAEINPLTVIPYKPKLQRTSNCNVHKPPSKPFVRQTNSLHDAQGINSGQPSVETVQGNSCLAKDAEECEAATGNAVGSGDSLKSVRGMRSD
jgi:hypothetical protein